MTVPREYRRRVLFDTSGAPIVDAPTYALERTHDLLTQALRHDATRRWWQLPDRLWVGNVAHALALVEHVLPSDLPLRPDARHARNEHALSGGEPRSERAAAALPSNSEPNE